MSDQITRDEYLIFDFDGTIADTRVLLIDAYNTIAPKLRLEPILYNDFEELREMDLKELIMDAGIPFWKLPLVVKMAQKEMNKHIS